LCRIETRPRQFIKHHKLNRKPHKLAKASSYGKHNFNLYNVIEGADFGQNRLHMGDSRMASKKAGN
jgi:hypothetical protein